MAHATEIPTRDIRPRFEAGEVVISEVTEQDLLSLVSGLLTAHRPVQPKVGL
jgi:hypothetical protein